MHTRLRASPRHGGARVFLFFFIHSNRRGGAPPGAGAIIVPDGERGNNSCLITVFSLIPPVLRISYPRKEILQSRP